MIEKVEALYPKLQLDRFPQRYVFRQHHIQVGQTRSDDRVPSEISIRPGSGKAECRRVEETAGAAVRTRQLDVLSQDIVGTDENAARSGAGAGCIAAHIDREREAGLERQNPRELNISKELRAEALVLRHREVVQEGVDPTMLVVEGGQAPFGRQVVRILRR